MKNRTIAVIRSLLRTDAGIVVHTVSMMTGYHPDMAAIAEITGGKYYRTTNAQQLSDAFRELARSFPVVLVAQARRNPLAGVNPSESEGSIMPADRTQF